MAEHQHRDPGAALEAADKTVAMGGRAALGSIGTVLGTGAEVLFPAIGSMGVIAGTVGGFVVVPPLIDYVADKVSNNPKIKTAAKIGMYGTLTGLSALLIPASHIPLAIVGGIAGIGSIVGYFQRRGREKQAKVLAERRASFYARENAPRTMPISNQPTNQGSPEVQTTMAV